MDSSTSPPGEPSPEASRLLDLAAQARADTVAELVCRALRLGYLSASLAAVLALVPSLPYGFVLCSYLVVVAGAAIGLWMKYILIRALNRCVHWGWWAWFAALVLVTVAHLVLDI